MRHSQEQIASFFYLFFILTIAQCAATISSMKTFRDVIALWPSGLQLARDLGVPAGRVKRWMESNRIPGPHLLGVIEAGKKRKIKLTAEQLLRLY